MMGQPRRLDVRWSRVGLCCIILRYMRPLVYYTPIRGFRFELFLYERKVMVQRQTRSEPLAHPEGMTPYRSSTRARTVKHSPRVACRVHTHLPEQRYHITHIRVCSEAIVHKGGHPPFSSLYCGCSLKPFFFVGILMYQDDMHCIA